MPLGDFVEGTNETVAQDARIEDFGAKVEECATVALHVEVVAAWSGYGDGVLGLVWRPWPWR